MKFLSVRDLRGKSAQVWKDLPNEREMIITSNGRPVAILAAINETNLEESLKAFKRWQAPCPSPSADSADYCCNQQGVQSRAINA